jgi:hypothetical protein
VGQVDTSLERISSQFVERGLYVLKYESSPDKSEPPVAAVRPAQGSESTIQIISAPGAVAGELLAPGSCVVVLAEAPGALHVSVRRRQVGGSLDATLHLERLAKPVENLSGQRGAAGQTVNAPAANGLGPQSSAAAFVVMGHVALRGDIEVGPGDWIAGPESPSPIEGVEIRSARPSAVQIETQVLIGSRPPQWSNWASPGAFAGTRGYGLTLAGVRFRLAGSEADQHELIADALFLGSPILVKRGREIELISPAGVDSLVGLRVVLHRKAGSAPKSAQVDSGKSREPRVRIFRAVEAQ